VRVKFDGTGRASCLVLHTATAFGCRLFRLYDDDDDSDDDDIMLIRRIWRQAVHTAQAHFVSRCMAHAATPTPSLTSRCSSGAH